MAIRAGQTATASDILNLVPGYTFYSSITGTFYEPVYNQYCDDTQFALACRDSTTLYYVNSGVTGTQTRLVTTDWASATEITSVVTLGAYLYVLMRDGSNNYRLYRYDKANLAGGGTLMTFSGQTFSTTGGADVVMTCNGTNFYFNYKAGNNASAHYISKYTLSGTTLTYSTDILCGSTSNFLRQLVRVDASDNIYGFYRSPDFGGDDKVRKYNSSGVIQYTTPEYQSYGKWRSVFTFGVISFLNRYVNTDGSSHNNVYYFSRVFL